MSVGELAASGLAIDGLGPAVEIGSDPCGVLYRARRRDGLDVAVKVLATRHPTAIDRLELIGPILSALGREAGFVSVHGVGTTTGGHPYLVLDLASGSLTDRLASVGPMAPGQACRHLASPAAALAEAHRIGLAHGGLGLDHLLVTADGHGGEAVVVADLGIAAVLAPPVMAGGRGRPERVDDVAALGAVLGQLLSGGDADPGSSLRLRGIPGPICEIVEAATDPDRAERPTMAELAESLAAQAAEPERGRPSAPPQSSGSVTTPPQLDRFHRLVFSDRAAEGSVFVGIAAGAGPGEEPVPVSVQVVDRREFDAVRRRLLRAERRTLARLGSDPWLVPLIEHGYTSDGRPYDVTPHLPRSLADVAADEGPLPWPRLVEVATMAASGLDALHRRGLTHRAVDRRALLVGPDGSILLGRYGWPSAATDGLDPDPAGDLGDLGRTLIELASADGDGAPSDALGQGPRTLQALLSSLVSDDPGRRPASARAVIDRLEELRAELDQADARPQPPVVRRLAVASPRARLRELSDEVERWARGMARPVLALALVAAIALGALWLGRSPAVTPPPTSEAGALALAAEGSEPLAMVPAVARLAESLAVIRLENVGLEAAIDYAFDPDIVSGRVISSTPRSGATASPGSVVDLLVSLGPEPACEGAGLTNVRRRLEQQGFSVAGIARSRSDSVRAEQVIRCVFYAETASAIIVVSDGDGPEVVSGQ